MIKLTNITIVLMCGLALSDCARILCVFPYPSISHQTVYRTLTDELSQRGHELVIITADPGYAKDNQTNIEEIDIHDATYSMWKAEMGEFLKDSAEDINRVTDFAKILHRLFVQQVKTAQFQKIIKEEDDKFDLLLLEGNGYSSLVLTHLIKAPVVLISSIGSLHNYNVLGVSSQELFFPTQFRHRTVNLSVFETIRDVYNVKKLEYDLENFKEIQNQWFKDVIGYEVSTEELQRNIDLLLLNHFPLWEGIRPVPQNVIHLGGMHIKVGEQLPQDLQQFINASINGVIYVSFDSLAESNLLSPEIISILVNVLSELPYDVLWKWDKGELPGKGQNIVTAKWVPQADLLRHPKIKLFITQGDLQSTDEAIAAGVPLIGIPLLNDQFFNTDNYLRHKIGLKLDSASLTEEKLKASITKVITDKGYRDNIFELRTLLRDKPKNSLAHAASWIDYVLKHRSAKHLQSPAAHMHWTAYLELELVFTTSCFFVVTLFAFATIARWSLKKAFRSYRSYTHRKMMDGMHYLR